jgi:hypothetical protein
MTKNEAIDIFIGDLEYNVAESVYRRMTGEDINITSGILASVSETEPIWFEKCQGFEGPCDSEQAYRRPQNTAYSEPGRNYATLCDECQSAANEYWAAMWREYNAGRF